MERGDAGHERVRRMVGEIEDDEDDYDVPLSDDDMDDFENDDIELDDDMDDVSPRERAARALEIRRALEARDEARRLSEDVDYLDFEDD